MTRPETTEGDIEIRQILYPTDFSELSLYALRYARHFAAYRKAVLHCLHVVDEGYQYMSLGPDSVPIGPPIEDLIRASEVDMRDFVAEHLADAPFEVVPTVISGRPFMEIIHYARENKIDLVVIATHGRGALKQVLLGSVAEKVVRKAPCPVLTVRHPDQEFVMP